MAASPILELKGLEKRYRGGQGVGPVDLALPPGIHGLLGPNGSGKTTLLKTVLGFLRPTAGEGSVLGLDIRRDPLAIRRRVGYMAESDVFVPGLNAAQTVRLGAELCGLAPARAHEAAAEALHAVGLGEERYHAPDRLSTGQRQKMKLAAALVHAPRILFLDEPTNGLDAQARRTMLALILEMAREKDISVVLSTHILPDVEEVCDDAILLRQGRLVATEKARGRSVERAGTRTWYRVAVLGDAAAFTQACRSARLAVREQAGDLLVAAASPAPLMSAARRAGVVLTRAVPSTLGMEDAVLAHLEEEKGEDT